MRHEKHGPGHDAHRDHGRGRHHGHAHECRRRARVRAAQVANADACPKSLDVLYQEKYLTAEAVDTWGQPLLFTCPGEHNKDGADIVSKGEDKQEGTPDDIKSWQL
jgi:hypothetical protein